MTHLDLFSGIGGFALAAAANNVTTKIFCEQNEHCRNFLAAEWGLPVIPDVRDFDGTKWRGAWLLTAGVPCQPASRAGKQRGEDDDRWLWPEALRVLEEAKPDWCIFENPPGILDMDFDGILSDMERIGYETQPFDIPACAVNAPQLRHRIWIVGCMGDAARKQRAIHERGQREEAVDARGAACGVADTESNGYKTLPPEPLPRREPAERSSCDVDNPGSIGQGPGRDDHSGHDGSEPAAAAQISVADAAQQHGTVSGREAPVSGRTGKSDMADSEREQREWRAAAGGEAESRRACTEAGRLSWSSYVWTPCGDGKVRRAPDESLDVVTGLHRNLLEAMGNSIVPQVAAEIIRAMIVSEP